MGKEIRIKMLLCRSGWLQTAVVSGLMCMLLTSGVDICGDLERVATLLCSRKDSMCAELSERHRSMCEAQNDIQEVAGGASRELLRHAPVTKRTWQRTRQPTQQPTQQPTRQPTRQPTPPLSAAGEQKNAAEEKKKAADNLKKAADQVKKDTECQQKVADFCNGRDQGCDFQTLNKQIGVCLTKCTSLFSAKTSRQDEHCPSGSTFELWLNSDAALAAKSADIVQQTMDSVQGLSLISSRLTQGKDALARALSADKELRASRSMLTHKIRTEQSSRRSWENELGERGGKGSGEYNTRGGKGDYLKKKEAAEKVVLRARHQRSQANSIQSEVPRNGWSSSKAATNEAQEKTAKVQAAEKRAKEKLKQGEKAATAFKGAVGDLWGLSSQTAKKKVKYESGEQARKRLRTMEFVGSQGEKWICKILELSPSRGYVCSQHEDTGPAVVCKGLMLPETSATCTGAGCLIRRPMVKQVDCEANGACKVTKFSLCPLSTQHCKPNSVAEDRQQKDLALHF